MIIIMQWSQLKLCRLEENGIEKSILGRPRPCRHRWTGSHLRLFVSRSTYSFFSVNPCASADKPVTVVVFVNITVGVFVVVVIVVTVAVTVVVFVAVTVVVFVTIAEANG